jgi:hypothetical protein
MKIGNHNDAAEFAVLDRLIDDFANELKAKVRENHLKGRRGWDTPGWEIEAIKDDLISHVAKNDPRDVAILAAFWWNRIA